jgi:carbon storage regulator
MLVLNRKKRERIVIGGLGEIIIEIVEIRPDRVKIGIIAPRGIPVHRQEVQERIWKALAAKLAEPDATSGESMPGSETESPGESHVA